jgi:radical SAM protein with 4Fe4S-binding SPASM domain
MFKVNPRVKWRWEGNRILLNTMMGLNETAGTILELCQDHHSTQEVVAAMREKYPDVDSKKIQKDTEKTLERLTLLKYIIPRDTPPEKKESPVLLPRYAERLSEVFNNNLSAPLMLFLKVTFACNCACPHCSVDSTSHFDPEELTTEEWKAFIDEASRLNIFTITFTGGEPTLRPDVEALIQHCVKRGITATVDTNGSLLTPEYIERLECAGLSSLQLNLDGNTPGIHNAFRGLKGLFEQNVEAISILSESSIRLQVASAVNTHNIDHIPDIMELLAELGVQRYCLVRIVLSGRALKNPHLFPTTDQYLELLPRIYEKEKELNDLTVFYIDLPAGFYYKTLGLDFYRRLKREGRIQSCVAGIVNFMVGPRGEVRPCDASGTLTIGNIREQSIKHIWDNNKTFHHLRSVTKSSQIPCKECDINTLCCGGCNALSLQIDEKGQPFRADPICQQCFDEYGGKFDELLR